MALKFDEDERLIALQSTGLLDTPPTEGFDRITRLAAHLFAVPIALVSLVDADRQWFKSRVGLDTAQTPREHAFCSHTIRAEQVLVVENTLLDERFRDNPLVTAEPSIRFYAGAPLLLDGRHAIGSLCLIDRVPRTFSVEQRALLQELAAITVSQIDLQRSAGRVDEVTWLPNHAQMQDDLRALLHEHAGECRTLVLVEAMDHGAVRDAARAIGVSHVETLLQTLSLQLQSLLSKTFRLYAVGVGRFAIVVDRIGGDLVRLIEQLTDVLARPLESKELIVELHAAIGSVTFTLSPLGVEDALRMAMTAVHRASETGQRHVSYAAEFDIRHQRAYAILRDIPRAIQHQEFRLVYQPKFRVRSGRYEGVEALIRWRHPSMGEISPGEFIPLAEGTPLIHDIAKWVLSAALSELQKLREEGFEVAMAVNASARNLEEPSFPRELAVLCSRYDVPCELLHLECTEYSGLSAPQTLESLHAIRELGVQLSLDDFGVGYSNLGCLPQLPVQLLKIDRTLVAPILDDPRTRQLLEGLVGLGHAMGFRLLAEGVETQAVFEEVLSLGFDHVQGYYLSRPLDPEQLRAFLTAAR
ncbi:MAG: EAL domain-containing protein [Pseudomonadota bacterium]|nr:EAL domain-containing protein [Pseudomonadota bacterium]